MEYLFPVVFNLWKSNANIYAKVTISYKASTNKNK